MLKIRLARTGRTHLPFYRIVLTESAKPVKSGYMEVLGWYNPVAHTMEANNSKVVELINNGAKPSERVAKILFKHTKDPVFQKFIVHRERTKVSKSDSK